MPTPRTSVPSAAHIRSLLDATERKVLHASLGAAVARATREQVELSLKRARGLRDKWRDLHAAQTRATKRSKAAGSGSNRRTQTKHDVFAGAVERLEARLAEFDRDASGGRRTRPSATAKRRAAAAGRKARGDVRGELKAVAAELNRARTPSAVPAGRVERRPVAAAAGKAAQPAVPAAPSRPAAAKPGKAKAAVPPGRHGVSTDASRQRSARAAAARARIAASATRRGGHALARTKRVQARRDGRGR